ncbi:Mannonate dehydratase [Polystyrenella longa]|uniref:mannonate dehydratase n=1 Tax=Polystyrenella longa TaxID=2528007 RepID=A0A518CI93_9PLAN|nr:mannonate dehydratase [Polystyrenella longa]QDU78959.1 Mannonate dehydratase [Polystyrenella longa]
MRLATVLTPLDHTNLTLAAQCGVTDVTLRYPGSDLSLLVEHKQHVEAAGMHVCAIEGYLPIENIKLGNDNRDEDLAELTTLIEFMGKAKIPVLCYNFMAGTDWVRTDIAAPTRGGALTTRFNLQAAKQAVSLNLKEDSSDTKSITTDELWKNLEEFLNQIIPIAEANNVALAMHPDDPPLAEFQGRARIMNSVENFERLLEMNSSAAHGICFCQGTFAEMGVDIPNAIRRLGSRIKYVHFRDIVGSKEEFTETFHDAGQTDMAAAMRAYREVNFTGPLRPDHVPQLIREEGGEPGYTMLGRLFAYGYIRGLMHATE